MRFTQHTALKAAEQIAEGVDLAKIEAEELSSLEAMIRAELQDRDMRSNPNQISLMSRIDEMLYAKEPF